MKILLVAERYWPEVGAAPSRLANMAIGLKNSGCEVDVLTSLPNYPKGKIFGDYKGHISVREIHEGVNLFRYWIYATISKKPMARIVNMFSFALMIWLFAFKRKRIKGYDCVIIQTPTVVVAASAMFLFKTVYGKKCILNVSDIWPMTAVDMGVMTTGCRSYRFMSVLERYLYKHADGVLGQSEEILNHVEQEIMLIKGIWEKSRQKDSDEVLGSKIWQQDNRLFLYRNLQIYKTNDIHKVKGKPLKLVFCGMLGVAQDVAGIVKHVPFKELGVEFHIFGGGKQYEDIRKFITDNPESNIYAHGFVSKEEIPGRLKNMDVGIVPLASRIRGAFPSKVFDIIPQGIPVLFCGGGEGASFINQNRVGLTSAPRDYQALIENIKHLRDMTMTDYEALSARCINISHLQLNFEKQMEECTEFIERIVK